MGLQTALSIAAAVVMAVLGTGGIVAIWKVRPEASKISVEAAEGAVTVATAVLVELRAENRRLADRLSELERTATSVEGLRMRIDRLEAERDVLSSENIRLRSRVLYLETELASMKNGGTT